MRLKVLVSSEMPDLGFPSSTGLEKEKKSLVEVDTSVLAGTESGENNGRRSVIRKKIPRRDGIKNGGIKKAHCSHRFSSFSSFLIVFYRISSFGC